MTTAALAPFRLAADFEMLRDRSDAVLAATGARPSIFLANIGPIARHTVRATWGRNLFEAGGIEALDHGGFDDVAAVTAAFQASGADLVCICGSDPRL